ncbi:MAG: hypothetical protein SVW51_16645 [Pseudomonadota bacterium]|nr:hypothetical protein [Pseudomonadota bacterium]
MIPEVKTIARGIELYVFDLDKITEDTVRLIDRNLVPICEGDSDTPLWQAKLTFIDFLENKDDTTKIGAIAEFFVHLFLREYGYNRRFSR